MTDSNWSPKENGENDGSEASTDIVAAGETQIEKIEDDTKAIVTPTEASESGDNSAGANGNSVPNFGTVYAQSEVTGTEPVYAKGCAGAAWEDVRQSKNWFGKIALMALIEFVPILNWVNMGYARRWSRELIFGKIENMPQKIFGERCFVTGAMNFLVVLLLMILLSIVTVALELIPIAGAVCAVILSIFAAMVIEICCTRMAIFDQLSEGFALGKGYNAGKGHWSKLFCAMWVPQFICGLIGYAIILVLGIGFVLYFALDFGTEFSDLAMSYGGLDQFGYYLENSADVEGQVWLLLLSCLLGGLPIFLIGWYFLNMCRVAGNLISARAAGHYAARYCADWRNEAQFKSMANLE